jgi:hypothetical protein
MLQRVELQLSNYIREQRQNFKKNFVLAAIRVGSAYFVMAMPPDRLNIQ